ncbi:YjfB family protein [Kineothrix sp. MSJ-39]|uniref:YjfB family protein n=1 Tax=Kineothrix sp. MSJ-39 TaxID=2841533 RepID=UPI001C102E3A|nr:YjfB family protein [Kineothrix sp. MSJ-39]MBU5430602.1 YjfB family protein [Kineothrix sp. MSJ-39]
MDIPALSMTMAQYNINSQVSVAMLSKSLDMSATMGDALTSMIDRSAMEHSVTPQLGANIDLSI